jgi:hypothetical protein
LNQLAWAPRADKDSAAPAKIRLESDSRMGISISDSPYRRTRSLRQDYRFPQSIPELA